MERYECDSCGACCRSLIVEIEETDIVREPKLAAVTKPFKVPPGMSLVDDDGEPYEEIVPGFGNGGLLACGLNHPCGLLGADNRCTVYPTRPNVCVSFRAGSEQCQEARRMAGLPELLPSAGIGAGEAV